MTKWTRQIGMLAMIAVALLLSACRQDMHDGPNYRKYRASNFFRDGQSARMPVENTVARGQLREDVYFYTGKRGDAAGNELPDGLLREGYGMRELLARGRNRFEIYCAPCHSQLGDGRGVVPQRGFSKMPASFHEERLKVAPLGHFYDVMTNGFGVMLNYKAQIRPEDRWAIAAYVRALQLSQDASTEDVPASERGKIKPAATLMPPLGSTVQRGTSTETGQRGEGGRPDGSRH